MARAMRTRGVGEEESKKKRVLLDARGREGESSRGEMESWN